MNVAEWLDRSARVFPDRPALLHGTRLVAHYREFARRVCALAGHLRYKLGIEPGARVAMFMSNRPEYFEVLYAAWWAGAATVPINAKLHPKEAAWIIEDAEASVLFISSDVGDALLGYLQGISCLREVIRIDDGNFPKLYGGDGFERVCERRPNDLGWLFYTSGTTGRPKGVMLTHANLAAMTACYFMDVDTPEVEDANVYSAPISHGAGLYHFPQIIKGARHSVPESGKFEANEVLDLSKALGQSVMFLAPTMVKRAVEAAKCRDESGDGIKTIIYGGGPMYLADIEEALDVMGNRFVQIYGQGESPMTITALSRALHSNRGNPNWRSRLASAGKAQSLVEVRVAGEDGRELPTGEVGEVLARGPSVMAGYWRQPEATAETLRDGWLWTGDMGEMDADGFLTLRDRSKDVIISGGSNIYPREVEEVLLTHPLVMEAAVVGRAHPDWGEEVVAFIITRDGTPCDTTTLDKLCHENIARFKKPKAYLHVESLPKNNYGKVLKSELRRVLSECGEPQKPSVS
ncbi:MAG: AMP-binding protein [Rhodomicrobium sp.]